jgi:NAD/NADP transhydrogenase alpha subunit
VIEFSLRSWQEFIDAEMALFLQQAKEVDIIVTTALIRKPCTSHWHGVWLSR